MSTDVDAELALSVVLPTRDRSAQLAQTLAAIADERIDGGLEVIVVDDGGGDAVEVPAAYPHPLHVETQPPRGPAAARNRGVAVARGRRVLFLGDDTRPAPGTLARHLEMASRSSAELSTDVAVQGHIDWDPAEEVTPLMDFLAPAGPQFYFRGLDDGRPIPFTAVLGSNLSAPRRWLLEEPFDEAFPFAAVEDTELAWRWRRRGWQAVYARQAVCWHHHRYDDLVPFLDRQRRAGASARHAVARHPRLLWSLVLQPTLWGGVVLTRRLFGRGRRHDDWDLACRGAFLRGFLAGARP
jgi:GT2 family glycosyltransferase